MIKCQQCRDKDIELLTRYERFKNWLFYKVNYIFFADDFQDLRSQKYTQGFSDGSKDGIKYERLKIEKEQKIYQEMVRNDKEFYIEEGRRRCKEEIYGR